jgi:hypothetical protein
MNLKVILKFIHVCFSTVFSSFVSEADRTDSRSLQNQQALEGIGYRPMLECSEGDSQLSYPPLPCTLS